MNIENIQYTIELLKSAENFDIAHFQLYGGNIAHSVEELHTCGNTACIAGYVAVSPRWKELGGTVSLFGEPAPPKGYVSEKETDDAVGDEIVAAMAKFWGLQPSTVESIIYGSRFHLFLGDNNIGISATRWDELTKDDAVKIFEHLLANGEQQ